MQPIQFPNGPDCNPKAIIKLPGDWWRITFATDLTLGNGKQPATCGNVGYDSLLTRTTRRAGQPHQLRVVARSLTRCPGIVHVSFDYGRDEDDFFTVCAPFLRVEGEDYKFALAVLRELPYTGANASDDQEQDAHGVMEDATAGA